MDDNIEQANEDGVKEPMEIGKGSLPINIGKAIGANTDYLSAQSFIFQNAEKVFLYIIAGQGEDAFAQIRRTGLDCRDNILTADDQISKIIPQALEYIKTQIASLDRVQVILVAVKHDILYCATSGGGQILLLRKGKLTEISKNITDGKLISGLTQPGDKVLIICDRVSDTEQKKAWDPIFIQDLLETPVEQLEEELEAYLQRFRVDSPIGIAALEIPKPVIETESVPIVRPLLSEPHKQPRLPLLPLQLFATLFESGRFKLIFALVVIGLVVFGVLGISQFRKQSQKNIQIKSLLTSSKQDLDHAVQIKDIDQDGAKAALIKSKQELQAVFKLDKNNSQAQNLQKEINSQSGVILKEFEVANFPVFLDLNLIKNGFSTQKLSYSTTTSSTSSLGKMIFLDPKQKTLILLDVEAKNPTILAGQLQLGDAQFASINGDKIFVYSKDKGVISIDVGGSKADVVIKSDQEWQRISDIFGFANNIYLLDEFKNQIWKYIATDSGFSQRNNYLRDGVTADFAGVKKMEIDGSVWVLRSNNTVLKFIQGSSDFFALQGFEQPMNNIKSFYVSDDTDNVYFLDNDNGRVVMTKKNGQYLGQYSGDKFKTADDLAVDEKNKKMYLLEAGKIYQIDLQ